MEKRAALNKTMTESDSETSGQAFDSDEATCDGEPVLPLKEEIRQGDKNAVRQALADGTLDPNARDDDYTLLRWASIHTDLDLLEEEGLLTDNMADRRAIVEELLKGGANPNTVWTQDDFSGVIPMTPMDLTEDKEVLQLLRQASVCWALAVDDSISSFDRANHLRIGLISAAALGQDDDCDSLWRLGADVNDNALGTTALGIAVAFGNLKTVEMLVQNLGANVNALLNENDGQTALYCAVFEGHEEIVDFLLKHDANPLYQTVNFGGMSKWACAGCLEGREKQGVDLVVRSRITRLILSASVEMVNRQVSESITYDNDEWKDYSWVFMECVRHGYKAGMDRLLENRWFELPPTCLQLATAVGDHDTLLYLLEAGALYSYNEDWEEERWYGPEFARPSNESIQRCRETLNGSLKVEVDIINTKLKEELTL